jgi:hypothetical protein
MGTFLLGVSGSLGNLGLDIYKNSATILGMKMKIRSIVGKGMNLSTRVQQSGKGKGSYVRNKKVSRDEY